MLYILVLAIAIAIVVFVANSKNRNKAAELKDSYLKRYTGNEELFSHNDFLNIIFTQLSQGNRVSVKDINEAFDIMTTMEADTK
ncbi:MULTISPECIES: hypothetical protein [Vibrio]|jgi:cell division protein FtsL|uniref:Uncharacterized protein n=1 Tax=Vibrio fortis TaxID=212667 RepID=A0A066V232_9VIBR|nr:MULTISPECIES: hypothetical protein [Vibrio]KAB0287106.1 hypothetical protein F2P58_21010 [Vibrio fortis]KDN30628.1 hypothetical protein VFDL14_04115 [Vibrio fortis]MDK9763320.1 hypothetical protein [Vibrio sp. D420a]